MSKIDLSLMRRKAEKSRAEPAEKLREEEADETTQPGEQTIERSEIFSEKDEDAHSDGETVSSEE